MKNKLLTVDVWTRITALAQSRYRKYVAVPFLGVGARRQLPLKRGDVLIVRFNEATVKLGETDPRGILHYLEKGVSVHSIQNLHAKVFVLGRTAIVGSTNISQRSKTRLVEAAVETTDSRVVQAARTFVTSLRGDIVEPQFAKRLLKLYNPPPPSPSPPTPRPRQSILWAVPLVEEDWQEEDYRQEEFAKAAARKRLKRLRLFKVDDFLWYGGHRFLDQVKLDQRVMMCTDIGKMTMVTPPGRVIAIRRYTHRHSRRMIVCLAIRQRLRRKEWCRFSKAVGRNGKPLKKPASPLQIRDPSLSYRIGAVWPAAEAED